MGVGGRRRTGEEGRAAERDTGGGCRGGGVRAQPVQRNVSPSRHLSWSRREGHLMRPCWAPPGGSSYHEHLHPQALSPDRLTTHHPTRCNNRRYEAGDSTCISGKCYRRRQASCVATGMCVVKLNMTG